MRCYEVLSDIRFRTFGPTIRCGMCQHNPPIVSHIHRVEEIRLLNNCDIKILGYILPFFSNFCISIASRFSRLFVKCSLR